MIQKAETLIIGAGVIGSSVAMHLARLGMTGIRVVDFDLEGSLSSSELNAGGVRGTFNQPINIEMSKRTIDYFATVADEVGYRDCGYLWLHTSEKLPAALKARERQVAMGWPVDVFDLAELKRRVPLIDKTDGIAGAVFGRRDGLVNPNLLKNHFRAKAREMGVVFDDRTMVRQAEYGDSGVRVMAERFEPSISQDTKLEVLSMRPSGSKPVQVEYQAKQVINCAGAWASEIARILGYSSPSYAVRRQICIFDCRDVDLTPYGMVIDTSGVYFHPEAANGLSGIATEEKPGYDYHYDGEEFFMEKIWPALYERSTSFERLKHLTGWSGLYEVSPDESAIIGKVVAGDAGQSRCVFEAHSFSGHGVMHSYAAGQLLAELIVGGRYETMDVSTLSAQRFETGALVHESAVI